MLGQIRCFATNLDSVQENLTFCHFGCFILRHSRLPQASSASPRQQTFGASGALGRSDVVQGRRTLPGGDAFPLPPQHRVCHCLLSVCHCQLMPTLFRLQLSYQASFHSYSMFSLPLSIVQLDWLVGPNQLNNTSVNCKRHLLQIICKCAINGCDVSSKWL